MSLSSFRWMMVLGACAAVWFGIQTPVHAQAVLTQNDYRFYVNNDNQQPTDPWPVGGTDLAENAAITTTDDPPDFGDVVRIRMNVGVTNDTLASGASFKLQYGQGSVCSSIFWWFDVDAAGGTDIWRGYDNSTPADGDALSSVLLSSSNVAETYEEQNNSSATPNAALDGETAEWDWVIQNNGAIAGAPYCFRMIYADGTPLDAFTDYPQLVTREFIVKSQDWIWYGDEQNETPSQTLAVTNTRPIGVRLNDAIKLRITLKETEGTTSINQTYSVQVATSTAFEVAHDLETGENCDETVLWCYADGVDLSDDVITTILLSDADTAGRHNESGDVESSFTHSANAAAEMEFTIKANTAEPDTLYYFRIWDWTHSTSVALNTGESYPFLRTFGPILEFSVAGMNTGSTVDNFTTNITTTAVTVPFGTLVPNESYFAAQRLTVSTDGIGYKLYVHSNGPLLSPQANVVSDLDIPNSVPDAWSWAATDDQRGVLGYHTSDDVLSGGSTRFQSDDTWAGLETTDREIVYSAGPIEEDIHDILYRIEISAIQPEGSYTSELTYVVVPEI